jgi:hypothetical protein
MTIRSFAVFAALVVVTLAGAGLYPPTTVAVASQQATEEVKNYYSEKTKTWLKVRYVGVNVQTLSDLETNNTAIAKSVKTLAAKGFTEFHPVGRLGVGPQSGKYKLACTFDLKTATKEVSAFQCSQKPLVKSLEETLESVS